MMMRLPEPPITGGEIYYSRLRKYLEGRFASVENISWQMKPYRSPIQYIIESILKNLSLLKHLTNIESNTIILEDVADSQDLFLFNAITKIGRAVLGKKIYIVPVVHHLESPLIKRRVLKWLKHIEEEIFFNSSDGVVVNSEFTLSLVKEALRRDVETVIAYPGLNISGLGKNSTNRLNNERLHLLFVGYVTSRKGVDTLIEAFEILAKDKGMDRSVLHIVGDLSRDTAFSNKIKEFSHEANLSEKVVFHGRIDDKELEDLYSNTDIFVFPSRWEGFGMVLAEAASFGLPIVTTNAGAIPYLIKDGINGLLIQPGDAKLLAQAIEHLARSPNLMAKFSNANRSLAEEFDWNKSFSKVERLMNKLASE
jgi:glycosyltransferase involved in cell wall biosynthesis